MIGTTLGSHRIVERLGEGGMGTVYRAIDLMLDREIAIKVLRSELTQQPELVERFRVEAIALGRLNHPNIATLHGLSVHGRDLFMAMEYVRGETLERALRRSGRIPWQWAVELCRSVLDALEHAHEKGVIHRDIKPSNIMLTTQSSVKVMDFGIARLTGTARHTEMGRMIGTPLYMSPEQLRGEDVDGRTDLYSLGVVLFELIAGRPAFEADSDYSVMMRQLHDEPPPPSSFVPGVPASIDWVIARAVAKTPDERFASAAAFRDALGDAVREATAASVAMRPSTSTPVPTEAAPSTPAVRSRTTMRRSEWRALAGAVVVLASAAFTVPAIDWSSDDPVDTALHTDRVLDSALNVVAHTAQDSAARQKRPASSDGQDVVVVPENVRYVPVEGDRNAPDETTPVREKRSPDRIAPPPQSNTKVVAPISKETSAGTVVTENTPPPPEPDVSAARQISESIERYVGALRGGDVGLVATMYDRARGADLGARDRLIVLMRERGLQVLAAQPDIAPVVRGQIARAEFDAVLSWRTPFGGSGRRPARFVAEFESRNGTWQMISCALLAGADLR
jgi:serine/threonine protein kinase